MKHVSPSLIQHREGYQTFTLYEDFIAITKNNHCKAALLTYIEQCMIFVQESNENTVFAVIRLQDFHQALFDLYSEKTIQIALTEMEREGLIERRQSGDWTRAFEYRLNSAYITMLLDHLPAKPRSRQKKQVFKKTFTVDPHKIISPQAVRAQHLLLERFHGLCAYCQKHEATTWDHIIPQSLDGPTLLENLLPACQSCNSSKGSRNVFIWLQSQGISLYPALRETIEQAYASFDREQNGGEAE